MDLTQIYNAIEALRQVERRLRYTDEKLVKKSYSMLNIVLMNVPVLASYLNLIYFELCLSSLCLVSFGQIVVIVHRFLRLSTTVSN